MSNDTKPTVWWCVTDIAILDIPPSLVESRVTTIETAWYEAARLLQDGEVVAFPTETVYGLGASALNPRALQKVFAAKHRPLDNPLIAHIANRDQLTMLTDHVTDIEAQLMDAFWPGPLSILFPAKPELPRELTAGLPQVAVRMPAHEVALGLIQAAGVPLAAPSANQSGRPSPTTSLHVLEDLAGRIAGVIDGGNCQVGIESTVIEVQPDRILILRPGAIDAHALSAFGLPVEMDPHLLAPSEAAAITPRAPGQKYRHYAPTGSLQVVFAKSDDAFWRYAEGRLKDAHSQGKKVALLDGTRSIGADIVLPLGDTPTIAAARLYRLLRDCDKEGIDLILARGFGATPEVATSAHQAVDPATAALLNRLYKASGGQFILVD